MLLSFHYLYTFLSKRLKQLYKKLPLLLEFRALLISSPNFVILKVRSESDFIVINF